MTPYYVWEGEEGWNEDGRLIPAPSERRAAELYAYQVVNLEDSDEGASKTVEISVTPGDRPHRTPSKWSVKVVVTEVKHTELLAKASQVITV